MLITNCAWLYLCMCECECVRARAFIYILILYYILSATPLKNPRTLYTVLNFFFTIGEGLCILPKIIWTILQRRAILVHLLTRSFGISTHIDSQTNKYHFTFKKNKNIKQYKKSCCISQIIDFKIVDQPNMVVLFM